jgi:Subtilase family
MTLPRVTPRRRWWMALLPPLALLSTSAGAIVNSSTGTSIGDLIGANTFYNLGYTGSRAVAINVEGGYGWSGHETLTHVSQFFDARPAYIAGGFAGDIQALGSFDYHATWMAQALGGRGAAASQRGIAYGATLWEGAIASSFVGGTTNWNWNRSVGFSYPYSESMITGRAGRTADVVNSSWGYADGTGSDIFTTALDGITRASARTTVFSAGNNGANASLFWGSPGGYNGIIVGALGASGNNYDTVASFSSRGPAPYTDPSGAFVANARARVDIVAPGQNITLARYGGATGGNTGGTDSTGGATNLYQGGVFGTSEASAIVAGGATLLNDVAYDRYAGNVRARDGEVIKAVLLNSARKIGGWANGQATGGDGVLRTTQALDYLSGAGALDLNAAFSQFTAGTNDLSGNTGGSISLVGWDYGVVSQGGSNNYSFTQALRSGAKLTATLNWFVGRTWVGVTAGGNIDQRDDFFTNLALQVWQLDAPGGAKLVAESDTAYLNTEHLSFTLANDGLYQLRVKWTGERYDFVNNNSQSFGLAWLAAEVPEASTWLLLLAGLGVVLLRAHRLSEVRGRRPRLPRREADSRFN